MRKVNRFYSFVVILICLLILSACQSNQEPVESTSQEESTEIASQPEPTEAPPVEEPTEAAAAEEESAESEPEVSEAPETAVTMEEKIANAMSAGPAPIAAEATILDYPEEGRGNWPDEVAPELVELRAGTNGWTCIVDIPDTPGNDPMCLNETYFEVLMSNHNLVDAPSTGVGFGYMLQGGGPIGSPPHMMVFVPESNGSFDAFGTEPGPFPWIMFPETSQQHLMVLGQ